MYKPSIEDLLLQQNIQLQSLLDLTNAINENQSVEELYEIYKGVLDSVSGLKNFLFVKIINGIEEKLVESSSSSIFTNEIDIKHKEDVSARLYFSSSSLNVFDYKFIKTLTYVVFQAIENKRLANKSLEQELVQKELETARKVQNMLFPQNLPSTDKLEMYATYIPHKSVSGDYYDYIIKPDGGVIFCIADVSGKGMPAALLMSNFQASLRVLVRQNLTLEQIVHELNHSIYINSQGERFITSFLAEYCQENKTLSYINSGHNPPFYVDKDHKIQKLKTGSVMLGIMDELPFLNHETITIKDYSLLFMYTDGLVEVFDGNGKLYSDDDLASFLINEKTSNLSEMHEELISSIDDFSKGSKGFSDDITILSCKFQY